MGRIAVNIILATAAFPIAMFASRSSSMEFIGGINIQALYVFIALMITCSILISNFSKVLPELFQFPFYVIFIIYAGGYIFWSPDVIFGLRFYIKIIAPFLFYLLIICCVKLTDIDMLVKIILWTYGIVAFIAVLNVLSGGLLQPLSHKHVWGRIESLYAPSTSPADFSFRLACAAIICLATYFHKRRVIYLLLFILFTIGVAWAFTRVSLAGLFFATVILHILLVKSFQWKVLIMCLLVACILLAPILSNNIRERMFYGGRDMKTEKLISLLDNPDKFKENLRTSGRSELWRRANNHFKSRDALFGSGTGAVDLWTQKTGSELHSDYLRIYYDLGLLGLVLYLIVFFTFASKLLRIYQCSTDSATRKYCSIAIALLLFYAITLLTDNSLNYISELGLYVYAFIGFAIIHGRNKLESDSFNHLITQPAKSKN